ncbi:hypothetical protein V8E53_004368, partial [Lactarius tabidus]
MISGLPDDLTKGMRCRSDSISFPKWLDDYMNSITEAPHLFDIIEFENARARHIEDETYYSGTCSCADISCQFIRTFWEALTAVVQRTIEEADSTLVLVKEEPTTGKSDPPSVPLCLDIPDANIILRSSDQANFHVHKSVLVISSPLFKDIFSLPQPPSNELVDGLPVIQLSESSGLL